MDSIGEDTAHETACLTLFKTVADEDDASKFLYPTEIIEDPLATLQRAFLSLRNCFIDNFNERMLHLISGNECECVFSLPL
jgi:hypothetical protein